MVAGFLNSFCGHFLRPRRSLGLASEFGLSNVSSYIIYVICQKSKVRKKSSVKDRASTAPATTAYRDG